MSQYYRRKRFKLSKFSRFALCVVIVGIVCIGAYNVRKTGGFPVAALLYQGGPASPEDEMFVESGETLSTSAVLEETQAESGQSSGDEITYREPDLMTTAAPQLHKESEALAVADRTELGEVDSLERTEAVAADLPVSSEGETQADRENTLDPMPLVVTHTVNSGETLWDIARKYNVTMDTIIVANQLTNVHRLRVGQVLKVPTQDGVLYTVRPGDSLWTISRRFNSDADKVVQQNGLSDPSRLRIGQELFIPGMAAVEASRYQLVGPDGKLRAAFLRPVTGGWISSRFGSRWGRLHAGVDIAVPTGTPVRAAADGVVKFSGRNGGYGLLVTIDHGEKVETRYGHNSRLIVQKGQKVKAGQIIAYSGNTGNSTGPHVHFEIRLKGQPYDPLKYIRQ